MLPASFLMLAYCFGLAAAQCLFFALLLIKHPVKRRRESYLPHAYIVALPIIWELLGVIVLPIIFAKQAADTKWIAFNAVQAFVMGWPILIAHNVRVSTSI